MNLLMIRLIIVELQFVRLSVGRFGISGQNLQDPQSTVPDATSAQPRISGGRPQLRLPLQPSEKVLSVLSVLVKSSNVESLNL